MKLRGLAHITFAYVITIGVAWATLEALGQSPIWDMFFRYRRDHRDLCIQSSL